MAAAAEIFPRSCEQPPGPHAENHDGECRDREAPFGFALDEVKQLYRKPFLFLFEP
jgi:hypothetical protein